MRVETLQWVVMRRRAVRKVGESGAAQGARNNTAQRVRYTEHPAQRHNPLFGKGL